MFRLDRAGGGRAEPKQEDHPYYSQQMGEDGSADKVQQWDGEKWLNFKYILKMEPTGFFIGSMWCLKEEELRITPSFLA